MDKTTDASPLKRVLFLHGWCSDGSTKSAFIRSLGYEVAVPRLSDLSFWRAVVTAQIAFSEFRPNVIVGSSRGGAVALGVDSGTTPLVLLAPAWKHFTFIRGYERPGVVIHSPFDQIIPSSDSLELSLIMRGLRLVMTGRDHQLNDPEARQALADALREFTEPLP